MHKCINNSIGNVYHLEQFVNDFFPYSQKQLGFDKPATIRFESDQDNAGVMLGKTAYYDPEAMEVVLYADGRHPKDVMRSLSHELVHHAQNCRGDFTGQNSTGVGYAQKDPHLRKMEREAYTKGNLIFRDFEDLIKTGKINIEIDFSDSGEPKMSLKEWKNDELNTKLMKKWGLLKEQKDSPRRNDPSETGQETQKDPSADIDRFQQARKPGKKELNEKSPTDHRRGSTMPVIPLDKQKEEPEEIEEILGLGSGREKAQRRIARGGTAARGRSMDKPAGHRDYKPDPSKGERDYSKPGVFAAQDDDDELEEAMPGVPRGARTAKASAQLQPRAGHEPLAMAAERAGSRSGKTGKIDVAVLDKEIADAIKDEDNYARPSHNSRGDQGYWQAGMRTTALQDFKKRVMKSKLKSVRGTSGDDLKKKLSTDFSDPRQPSRRYDNPIPIGEGKSQKISVREARQITRRIIERIKKESK